ncbi:protein hook homolog [Galleria mellonella]|uniref:Protein hook homolog n=1 Tax=Galleria mellonella TaxID=7137 RepID=A0A6J1WSJ9_GALME|nr:protein hook homolog [Galleria mellonella]
MDSIDNNQFEVIPCTKAKRKIVTPCPTAYLNPALDLLVNEDPICNTAMEIVPIKKRKRSKSCDIAAFENTALDVGVSKAAVNELLVRELENVRKNLKSFDSSLPSEFKENTPQITIDSTVEPVYANLTDMSIPQNNCTENSILQNNDNNIMDVSEFRPDISEIGMDSGISILEQKSLNTAVNTDKGNDNLDTSVNTTNIQTNVTNQIFINNTSNLNLSFIDRLALDSPNLTNQSLYLDDDLNESNIMEIKTITIITKKKRIPERKQITNPFLDPNLDMNYAETTENPFLDNEVKELEYNVEITNNPAAVQPQQNHNNLLPRRLFVSDTNSTISTVNESLNVDNHHEYENVDSYRAESPIYENVRDELDDINYNKQSKILGCDVSQFSAVDIMNLNRNTYEGNSSSESNENKKDFKHQILKASNKLSRKVLKTLKRTFKGEKPEHNTTLNPYEVPRKPPKQKVVAKDSGIENPALNLDNSDEIEIEEVDEDDIEHQYETIKTLRNTQLNMNVTPLKERAIDNIDVSHNRTNTPGKKVRFDSTLNQEKIITGNSFDYELQSPGFDSKIDKYHDELENCINERKFLQQNM